MARLRRILLCAVLAFYCPVKTPAWTYSAEPTPAPTIIQPKQTKLFEGLEFNKGTQKKSINAAPTAGPAKSPSNATKQSGLSPKKPPRPNKRIPWELEEISQTPSQPKILGAESEPKEYFDCGRTYFYRNKALPCDSPIREDGRGLTALFSKVPEAKSHLDKYQSSWRGLKPYAYVGAVGLGLMFSSVFMPKVSDGKGGEQRSRLSKSMMFGGLGLFGATITVGYTQMRLRERHLNRAVEAFNLANPADPVVIQVQVGVKL